MRKRMAIALALLMAFSLILFPSCGDMKAYSVVSDAVAKTKSLDSFEADMGMNVSMEIMGISSDVMTRCYQIKAAGLTGTRPVTSTMVSETPETAGTMAYIEDGWCYVDALGQKIKMDEGTEQYDGYSDLEAIFKSLPRKLFSSGSVTENEDGTKTACVAISDKEFTKIYGDFVGEMTSLAALEETISDISIVNGKAEIIVDQNGYVSLYRVCFDMDLKIEALEDVTMDGKAPVEIEVAFHNPGVPVTVAPPDGYQSFEEAVSYKAAVHTFVKDAVERTGTLDSYDAVMDIGMKMEMMGDSFSMPSEYRIKAAGLTGESPIKSEISVMTALGTMTETEIYTDRDWCYVRSFSSTSQGFETMKIRMDENVSASRFSDLELVIKVPAQELFSGAEVKKNKDGSKTVSFVVPNETFADIYGDLVDEMSSSAAQGVAALGGEVSDVSVANAEVEITVDQNGYISKYDVQFDLSMTLKYQNLSFDVTLFLDVDSMFRNPGTAVTVEPPAGYLHYEEYAAPPWLFQ